MAPSAFEPPHILSPIAQHTHTVIALHGRGSQGAEFADELFEEKTSSGLSLQQTFPSCKWVFPSSQERYSTVFQEELDEWFDIYSLSDPTKREDLQREGLHDSAEFIQKILSHESTLVTPERVILLGLSQGSAIGLITLLSGRRKIGAYIGLSGWMPLKAEIAKCRTMEDLAMVFRTALGLETSLSAEQPSMLDTPVLLAHTTDDEVIDIELGQQACKVLRGLGMNVAWKEQNHGGHLGMLKPEGLDTIVEFLEGVLDMRTKMT